MNKKLKQLSAQFPDLLSTYKTNWSPEPFDFLLQEEKTVIDIDTVESVSKNKEQILKKVKAANAHGYTVIRILDTPNVFNKLVLKRANQFICPNNEYNELIQCLEAKEEKEAKEAQEAHEEKAEKDEKEDKE
jgi:very-short-patch-repair endonuclease